MIVSKNWFTVIMWVTNRSFVLSVSMIWKIKQTLSQVNPRTSRNGVIQTKRIPWNTAECKYIILKQKPQIGLNRFVREENVSTMRIQPYSFCEEPQTSKPKLEIQYMLQFLFHNNCDHTKPIFLQRSYANQYIGRGVHKIHMIQVSQGLKSTCRRRA